MVDKQIDAYTYVPCPTNVSDDKLPWSMLVLGLQIMLKALSKCPKGCLYGDWAAISATGLFSGWDYWVCGWDYWLK